jgi:hypothetical protein
MFNSVVNQNRPLGLQTGTNGAFSTRNYGFQQNTQHFQRFSNQNNNKQQSEITKRKEINYHNSILFKFEALDRPYKYDEIINVLDAQLPSAVIDSITAFRPIGSNKKWLITFNSDVDAVNLVNKSFEMDGVTIKFIDPNADRDVKHAIVRIHWLPPGITDSEIKQFITSKFPKASNIEISEESYPNNDNKRLNNIKSGVRRIKFQIQRTEEYKLQQLVGKTAIEGHKALVTVPGIKMCLKCLEFGHIKSECNAGERCRKCHAFGHLANQCSTANKIMTNINAEKEEIAKDLISLADDETAAPNLPEQQTTRPSTTTAQENNPSSTPNVERSNNKRIRDECEASPTSNVQASKQIAINDENDEDYEEITENNEDDNIENTNGLNENTEDDNNENENNDSDKSAENSNLSNVSEQTLGKMMEECKKLSKKDRQRIKTKELKEKKKDAKTKNDF